MDKIDKETQEACEVFFNGILDYCVSRKLSGDHMHYIMGYIFVKGYTFLLQDMPEKAPEYLDEILGHLKESTLNVLKFMKGAEGLPPEVLDIFRDALKKR